MSVKCSNDESHATGSRKHKRCKGSMFNITNSFLILTLFFILQFKAFLVPFCLHGSDHKVIASYSGLHEECEVHISMCLA